MSLDDPRQVLARVWTRQPDATAIIAGTAVITYRELRHAVEGLARAISGVLPIDAGAPPQVLIRLPNSVEFVVWLLAVFEARAVAVPVASDLPEAEIERLVHDGGISHRVQSTGFAGAVSLLERHGARMCRTSASTSIAADAVPGPLLRQFSSGSTGIRKQMLKTPANIAHDVWHFRSTLGLDAPVRMHGALPLQHAFGALALYVSLLSGGTLVLEPRFLPGASLGQLALHRPEVVLVTPAMLDLYARARIEAGDERAFERVRYCISSAGALRRDVYDAFSTRFDKHVTVQYGSTETLSACVDLSGDFLEGRMGTAYEEVTVAVFDGAGARVAPGETGVVGIRSPAASLRYEAEHGESPDTFRNGWVMPGDRGWLDPQGCLHVVGRDDVANVGGRKVDPVKVERALRALPGVRDAVVYVERDGARDVLAAAVEAPHATWSSARLQHSLVGTLAAVEIPSRIMVVTRLPRDSAGKVRRDALTGG